MGQSTVRNFPAGGGPPAFLDLPPRSSKPRATGLTHVLDMGRPAADLGDLLQTAAAHIDIWKFGFGTAYIDPAISDKVALLDRHAVTACIGGTLLEVSWMQDRVEECLQWAADVGFPVVEVSNGAVLMPPEDKRRLIKRAAADFVVVSEVGSKDADAPVDAAAWRDEMLGDLAAGAKLTLAEGRASGTVGLYRPDGSVRADLVELLVTSVGSDRVIFEAPRATQQAWFIRTLGNEVSLGNVNDSAVIGLEALRLGLRADTLDSTNVAAQRWSGDGR